MPQMKQSMGVDQKIQLETLIFFIFFCQTTFDAPMVTEARQIGIGPQCARDETRWLQCERGLAARSHSAGCRFSVVRSWGKITLWLFNIAMENGPFIEDFPIKTSIYKGFSMAMLNNQMVEQKKSCTKWPCSSVAKKS